MRKFLVLFAVAASLCALGYAQSSSDGSSANSQQSDALPPDAQPVNAPAPQVSLGDYARQMRLKKQQHEAQLQQAKEDKQKQTAAPAAQAAADAKPTQPTSEATPEPKMAAAPQVEPTPTVAPAAEVAAANATPSTKQAVPQPQTAAAPHIEQSPAVGPAPQPRPQIVTTTAVPARTTVTTASVHQTVSPTPQPQPAPTEAQVREWKAEILQQKSLVASLQQDITNLNSSIHPAGGNCIANCDQWNDRQKQKTQDLETLKAQLQEQQDILAEMLEAERVLTTPSQQASAH